MLAQMNILVQLPEVLIGRQHLWLSKNYASSISPKWMVISNESLIKLNHGYSTELKWIFDSKVSVLLNINETRFYNENWTSVKVLNRVTSKLSRMTVQIASKDRLYLPWRLSVFHKNGHLVWKTINFCQTVNFSYHSFSVPCTVHFELYSYNYNVGPHCCCWAI